MSEVKAKITPDMLAAPGEIRINVPLLNGDDSFLASFDDYDPKTDREYRSLANKNSRNGNLSQKSLEDAMVMAFEKKFRGTNIDWNGQLATLGYETEKDYFLKDLTGRRYLKGMVEEYLTVVRVNAEYAKN